MRSWLSILLICIKTYLGYGQNTTKPLFQSNEIIEITLASNLKEIINDDDEQNAKYHPAVLSYNDGNSGPVNLNVKIKTRGHFRRLKENCNFPPLRIKFQDKETDTTIFNGQNKLKLVTSCRKANRKYEQFILKEYYIYKIYNEITEISFRTRLVKINYIDLERKIKNFSTYAFFIEDENDLAERTGGKIIETQGIHQDAVDQKQMNELAVFEYLIGNTDWSVIKLHNIKLIVYENEFLIKPIPYDFDFCGLVNPPYTKPPEFLEIKHVTDRLYRGFCKPKDILEPTLNKFKEQRELIKGIFLSDTLMDIKEKERCLRYVDEFYDVLKNEKSTEQEFYIKCRNN